MRRLPKRLFALLLFSFLALLVFVPAAGAHEQSMAMDQGMVTISIRDNFFNPPQASVAPGTTVVWVNEGMAPHTVTSDDGQFDSETLMPGDSFAVVFSGQGTLTYHCEIHPSMVGSVTVG